LLQIFELAGTLIFMRSWISGIIKRFFDL